MIRNQYGIDLIVPSRYEVATMEVRLGFPCYNIYNNNTVNNGIVIALYGTFHGQSIYNKFNVHKQIYAYVKLLCRN